MKTKFKQTEIGKIPNDWEVKELGEVADVRMGQSPPGESYNQRKEGLRFLQGIRTFGEKYPSFDTYTTHVTKEAKAGSILLSVRAPVGEVNITKEDLCIGRGLAALNMKNENNEFLYYLLKRFNSLILGRETGSVFGSIDGGQIRDLRLPFPLNKEQKSIAKVLSDLDAKIELNNKINKVLEAIGQALFKKWFVDERKKEWKEGKLGEFIKIKNGFAFKGRDFSDKGVPVIKIKNVKARKILLNNLSFVSQDILVASKKYKIDLRDILITMSGNRFDGSRDTWVGKVAMFNKNGDYLLNQRVSILKIKEEFDNLKYYLYILLSSNEFQDYFINSSTSSGGQANISPDLVSNTNIIIPDKNLLEGYNLIMDYLFNKICFNEYQIQTLSKIRDALLPKLMNGEIRVK